MTVTCSGAPIGDKPISHLAGGPGGLDILRVPCSFGVERGWGSNPTTTKPPNKEYNIL